MPEVYRMDPDLVRHHARSMEQLAEEVAEAVEASRSVTAMSGEAFGLMCSFLVPPAVAITSAASAGMAAEERMLGRTATELRAVASEAEEAEQRRVEVIRGIEGSLR